MPVAVVDSGLHVSLEGLFLALLFAGLMGSLLFWMLHVPPPVPEVVARVTHAVGGIRRIMVPTVAALHSQRAVELAARLAEGSKAELVLVHVIEVPLILPLNAPLPEAERKANESLETAAEIARYHDLPVRTRVQRARLAGSGIVQASQDEGVDTIVLGIKAGGPAARQITSRTAEWILERVGCEVIIDRLARK